MYLPRFTRLLVPPVLLLAATPAMAAPWWYVDHGQNSVTFIDAGSIERDKDDVSYTSKVLIRDQDNPVAMTVNFMRGKCAKRQIRWHGTQSFGRDEAVIDTTIPDTQDYAAVARDTPQDVELNFACSGGKAGAVPAAFPLTIDDAAFTAALLAETSDSVSPRALHDRMAADPATPVIRSTAPPPSTFGQTQTVKRGQPIVPPRDYSKGPHIPDPKDYSSIEVGRIYDISYQGIKNGQIEFEVRGYSIDDLVHPGSGQTHSAELSEKKVHILDLAITIKKVTPDSITYSVQIEKQGADDMCPPGGCS